MKNATSNLLPELQTFASLLALSPVRPKYRDAQPANVQEALQFLLATAMHQAGKFELLNVARGFPAKPALLVTAMSHCQKTSHPKKPATKLPTMELAKLTQSLFSQRQGAV